MRKIALLTIICLLITLVMGCSGEDTNVITMKKYKQIKEGMTYMQVAKILGAGEKGSTSGASNIDTTMIMWRNADGSNMNVTFHNNKVIGKAQSGLR